ncbi:hypothetical protein BCB4_0027 [Bacillus phage B4]|uniref:Uncharacterized protein n=2 Tax=Bequatrovirus B4 TaxID=1918005 RepID=J9Q9W0_9CAUD|nr:hypothetical protein BCB4_0027 [Bacillus phage B4]YP_009783623.1 hypothetical protein QLX26_gp027 [Bacillus phage B5S]AEW47261.1 hypothetical protein B5S_0027 [Bacillus phage B5S]AEZ65820.1 hypothetical protein BCB4_0027 [Bacillus phage B4]
MKENQCNTCEDDIAYNGKEWVLVVETSTWSDYDDWWVEEHIPINYCPECGKHYIEDEK